MLRYQIQHGPGWVRKDTLMNKVTAMTDVKYYLYIPLLSKTLMHWGI